jgi:outer membrane protein assembly factor BamD
MNGDIGVARMNTCDIKQLHRLAAGVLLALLAVACSSNKVSTSYTGANDTEQGYYKKAVDAMRRSQFDLAESNLKSLDTYYPSGAYTEQAQLDLMYSQYRQGQFVEAAATGTKFINNYPEQAKLDYAYYLAAVALMAEGQSTLAQFFKQNPAERDQKYNLQAFNLLNDLTARFPNSEYYNDAVKRMRYIRNLNADKVLATADFSLKRKSYVAAIKHAQTVLEQYGQSTATLGALKVLVAAYTALGQDAVATSYQQVLQQSQAPLDATIKTTPVFDKPPSVP